MSNFIFVSPDFPQININLCEHLAASGVRVLGIGDAEYDGLDHRLKSSLAEYYRVTSLEDYGEVYRAVAYYTIRTVNRPALNPTTRIGSVRMLSCGAILISQGSSGAAPMLIRSTLFSGAASGKGVRPAGLGPG